MDAHLGLGVVVGIGLQGALGVPVVRAIQRAIRLFGCILDGIVDGHNAAE